MLQQHRLQRRCTAAKADKAATQRPIGGIQQQLPPVGFGAGQWAVGRCQGRGIRGARIHRTTVKPSGLDSRVAAPVMVLTLATVRLGAVPAVCMTCTALLP